MATSTRYDEAMTATARELAGRLATLLAEHNELWYRVNMPVCGKPGRGFKAARKLRPQLARLESTIACVNDEIAAFIRPNSKMSKARADARRAYLVAACEMMGIQPPA